MSSIGNTQGEDVSEVPRRTGMEAAQLPDQRRRMATTQMRAQPVEAANDGGATYPNCCDRNPKVNGDLREAMHVTEPRSRRKWRGKRRVLPPRLRVQSASITGCVRCP